MINFYLKRMVMRLSETPKLSIFLTANLKTRTNFVRNGTRLFLRGRIDESVCCKLCPYRQGEELLTNKPRTRADGTIENSGEF